MSYLDTILDKPDFHPQRLSGLRLWLDSSDLSSITKDGSNNVSVWGDKSGGNNDATQGTGANQPTWVADQLNGKSIIRFNDDRMVTPDINLTDFTGFVVFNNTNIYPIGSGDVDTLLYHEGAGARPQIQSANGFIDISEPQFGTENITANRYINGQSVLNRHPLSANNYYISSVINTGGYSHNGQFGIGGRVDTDIFKHIGDIAEIIIYNRALSAAERTLVENYLSNKWGIALS